MHEILADPSARAPRPRSAPSTPTSTPSAGAPARCATGRARRSAEVVKVVSEPRSNAILNVGRWRWHKGEDRALWLEEFRALRLFVSDFGSDLVWAIDARGDTN